MAVIKIKDASKNVGKEATIQGWIFNKRSSGKIAFLQIRDGSGVIQGIVTDPELLKETEKITLESSLKITGEITKHPKKEEFEIQVSDIEIVQLAPDDYPIGKKEHGPEFLLNNRHLWLRSPRQWAIQRIRNTIINGIYGFLNQEGFIKIDAPILTPNACEGTTTLFEMDYFDLGKAYLSQSGQLYIEAAIFSVGRCFDFGPVFRAEKSKTRRHLTEFWMMDAEAAFVEYEENMEIQENMIVYIIQKVLKENKKELEILERDTKALESVKAPFPRKTHKEIVKELNEMGSDIKETEDLGGDDETLIGEKYNQPVFITHWPKDLKAFYMKRDETGNYVLGNDLIAPEGYGEIIGGSQREDDYETLLQRTKEHKLPLDSFQWYLDLRKYGSVPH
ncbi:MAG TPA: asparagine--tRNA ligase, partial [Candidatus Peregrinibacteria bacterium]|nr:asparagine--tRNA ligase [Candidatus Peregrinibacteria bacterium]